MKSIALMGITVFSRLGGTFFLFVFLARFLSVTDFGNFVVAYSAATILAVMVDFGFSQSLLKDIGSTPTAAGKFVREGLLIKSLLSGVAALIAGLIAMWLFEDASLRGVFFLLVAFSVTNSFSEYLGAALRSIGRYTEEAVIQFLCTGLMLILVSYAGLEGLSLFVIVVILLISKLLQFAFVWKITTRNIDMRKSDGRGEGVLATIRRGLPYAADQGVSNVLANVDVLIVSQVMGNAAAAIYQSGQKLVQGYSASALILSNVYLPRLARAAALDSGALNKMSIKVGLCMVLVGLLGGVGLSIYSSSLVALVYGEKFQALVPVLPFFGALIFLRFCSGALGLYLTAIGKQTVRVLANGACLVIVLVASTKLIEFFGVKGMVLAQLMAVLFLLIMYVYSIYKVRLEVS